MDGAYSYYEAVVSDVIDYLKENHGDLNAEELRELHDDGELEEEMWLADSVTGNASGSYTFSTWKAEECLCHNYELISQMADSFGDYILEDYGNGEFEKVDVCIRCYLLGECITAAIDQIEEEERRVSDGWEEAITVKDTTPEDDCCATLLPQEDERQKIQIQPIPQQLVIQCGDNLGEIRGYIDDGWVVDRTVGRSEVNKAYEALMEYMTGKENDAGMVIETAMGFLGEALK